MRIRAATRGSPLARWQTAHVGALIAAVGVDVDPVVVSTTGDVLADTPIRELGGKGLFVKEVQAAVLSGDADIAVHSMKDLPAATPEGLTLAAVPLRADPRDALVGAKLNDLPRGARVATGAPRRRAQLAALRPDIELCELRGNIATRLAKAADFDAVVMAAAALERLGEAPPIVDLLEPSLMLPQVGQGALAIECRSDAVEHLEILAGIEHRPSRAVTDVERSFLGELGGDCDLPAAAHGEILDDGRLRFRSLLASPDGSTVLRDDRVGELMSEVGALAARHLLQNGGLELLGPL